MSFRLGLPKAVVPPIARVVFDTMGLYGTESTDLTGGGFVEGWAVQADPDGIVAGFDGSDVMVAEDGFYRVAAYWTAYVRFTAPGSALFSTLLGVYGTYEALAQPHYVATRDGYAIGRVETYTNMAGDPTLSGAQIIELIACRLEGESALGVVDQANSDLYGNGFGIGPGWEHPGECTFIDIERLGPLRLT